MPGSYRGITVTSVIGKILETCLQTRLDKILKSSQNKLQRGFTEGVSPLHAGLIISEAYFEAKDNKTDLILQTFDAEKAFDIVWHDSLLRKLFIDGVGGDLWLLVQSLHTDAHTLIKWNGELSNEITLQQGIRQGAKLSTLMYKRFNNNLLDTIQESTEGIKIGTADISSPTCADDIALLTENQADAQILTNTIDHASSKDRFLINPSKSEIIKFKTSRKAGEKVHVHLGTSEISQVRQTIHLGVERNETNTPDTQKRIQTARKTMYALLGSGMHGKNGISPIITVQMWNTFVIPRLLHGIELLDVRKKNLEDLEVYQRKILKQLQSLPERTASVAVLGLVGVKTIEAQIDIKILTTFLNIAKDPSSLEHQLAHRQLLIKSENSGSWFIKVKQILHKYDLPEPVYLLHDIRSEKAKKHWKNIIKKEINAFWHFKNVNEIQGKSTLRYLKLQEGSTKYPHQLWLGSKTSPRVSHKSIIKAKILTDTYRLQSNKAKFNKYEVDPTCILCKKDSETLEHFVLNCEALKEKRDPYIDNILRSIQNSDIDTRSIDTLDKRKLMELILDCSSIPFTQNKRQNDLTRMQIESIGRDLLFTIHSHRASLLRNIAA